MPPLITATRNQKSSPMRFREKMAVYILIRTTDGCSATDDSNAIWGVDELMLTQSEVLREACATCPPSARIFCTVDIRLSLFAQPARGVASIGDDVVLGIGAAAPRDTDAMVTFLAMVRNLQNKRFSAPQQKLR
jgi:hypothetical protein